MLIMPLLKLETAVVLPEDEQKALLAALSKTDAATEPPRKATLPADHWAKRKKRWEFVFGNVTT